MYPSSSNDYRTLGSDVPIIIKRLPYSRQWCTHHHQTTTVLSAVMYPSSSNDYRTLGSDVPIIIKRLDTFNFRLEDVQEKLNHLNVWKSTGPDLLHPRVLLTLEDIFCGPLNHIFNKSAETGIIPADWKSVNVTAIHKKMKQTGTWKLHTN